jgi:uncharacterized protein (DUF983 family)
MPETLNRPPAAPLALVLQRCPRCREGALFSGVIEMHPRCTVCGLSFEPEVGYYTGAMVVSYTLSIPLLGLVALAIGLITRWDPGPVILAASALFLVFVVPLFRYARTIWLYLDWLVNPGSFRA